MITRRKVLGAVGMAPFIALPPKLTLASILLGDTSLTTVSDGTLTLPGDFIFGSMPADELPAVLASFGVDREQFTPECNLTLYRDGTRTVLFDARCRARLHALGGQAAGWTGCGQR